MPGSNSPYSQLDQRQVTVQSFDEANDALRVIGVGGSFVVNGYDYIALTYVASGNGQGEIETATYKTGGSSGTTIAVLTLTYDASNRLSTVTRT